MRSGAISKEFHKSPQQVMMSPDEVSSSQSFVTNVNRKSNRASTNIEAIRRIIVLGDTQVGKTSIVRRIVVSYSKILMQLSRTTFLLKIVEIQSILIL
jgi:GTPase SAR1 family protein